MAFKIPTISFMQPRAELITAIRAACLTHGFFQLTSSTVSPELQPRLFAYMQNFFALPSGKKEQLLKQDHINGGYERYQTYSLQPGRAGNPDLNEGFTIAPGFCINQWPEETIKNGLIGFRKCCEEYYAAVDGLGRELGSVIAEGLGLDRGYFDEYFEGQMAHARLIHYFAKEEDSNSVKDENEDPVGAGLHTDWGLITILLQDSVGGLEVLDRETNTFIPVPYTPGAFVVNFGDLLSRFTNNVYVSAQHRVIAPKSGVHRYSVPFFSDGNPDYVVDVLPLGCEWKEWVEAKVGREPEIARRLWEPVKAGVYFEEKWRESNA